MVNTMLEKRMKEANVLRKRITLLDHIEGLLHTSISKIEKPALIAHVEAVLAANIPLPFDIRLQLLQRYCEDCVRQMQTSHEENKTGSCKDALERWLRMISIWEGDASSKLDEMNMTFRWVLDCRIEQLDYEHKFKGMTKEAFETESQQAVQEKGDVETVFCCEVFVCEDRNTGDCKTCLQQKTLSQQKTQENLESRKG